jgi:hypothetical protein
VIALVALLTAASLYLASQQEQQDDFLLWKSKFGYSWSAEEDAFRRLIYLRNL